MTKRQLQIAFFLLLPFMLACAPLTRMVAPASGPEIPIIDAYIPHIGQVSEFADQLGHHLFVTQERRPDFDGVIWHYSKIDPRTNARTPGDDGLGYWCVGDPDADLHFGLSKSPDASWSSTHQVIRCHGDFYSATITGPGYLIVPAHTGTTGPVTYSQCRTPGEDWSKITCAIPEVVGWQTDAGFMAGVTTSHQKEGPCVQNAGRCFAEETWDLKKGDMVFIHIIDSGNGPGVDPRLSMQLVGRFNL